MGASLFADAQALAMRLLPRGQFARSVVLLAGGSAVGQLLVVAAMPVVTRLYGVDDVGALSVYAAVLSVLTTIVALRYDAAIPLPEDDAKAANVLVLSLLGVLVISGVTALGVWAAGDRLPAAEALRGCLWLIPVGMIGAGIQQALTYWAVRRGAYSRIAATKVTQGIGRVATQLGFGILASGPTGLLLGDAVGRAGGSGRLALDFWRADRALIRAVNFQSLTQMAQRYRAFPLVGSWSALLNAAGLNLPTLVLAAAYGPRVAGLVALCQQVISAPTALIGRAVANVYVGEAARLARSEPAQLRRLFHDTTRQLLLLGVGPTAVLALLGPTLFGVVFGAAWTEAGQYARLLAVMFLAQFVVVPISLTLTVLEQQRLQLAWDAGRLLLVVGGIAAVGAMGLSATVAVTVFGITMLVAYTIAYLLSARAVSLAGGSDAAAS